MLHKDWCGYKIANCGRELALREQARNNRWQTPYRSRCVKGGAVDVLLSFRASRRLLTSAVLEGATAKAEPYERRKRQARGNSQHHSRLCGRSRPGPPGAGWLILADPEGNEFCLEGTGAD